MNVRTRRVLGTAVVLALYSSLPAGAAIRSIDGSGNNQIPARSAWGAAGVDMQRVGYPGDYPDGYGDIIHSPTSTPSRPNARTVSNTISSQSRPVYNNRNLSDWIVQWGQFITHDMDLTTNSATFDAKFSGGVGDYSIPITDSNDPLGPSPIPFHRSNYDLTTGTTAQIPVPGPPPSTRPNWREQINSITSYIDASNVYGSDATRAAALRTYTDGKLVTTAGGLLPGLNTPLLENDDPFGLGAAQFLAGDVRANEQVGLTAVHALFTREHNRLAAIIKTQNPSFNDETIYQTARKIVGAEMQKITYEEFLPALLGSYAPNPNAYVYNNNVNATITNSFATAFFRYGHSMQSSKLQLVDNSGLSSGNLSLLASFFNPDVLKNDLSKVDLILKGLAAQVAQENDALLVDDIRNFLFGPPGAGGLDLGALDIQRGRDHGLNNYNVMRISYGLAALPSFNQLTSDPTLRAALTTLYGNINNLDAFVGGIVENHLAGTSVGRMVETSLVEQFTRLRDGDRFFYTGDPDLLLSTYTTVIDLDDATLAQIIRWNTGVTNIQDNVFFTFLEADFNHSGKVDAADLAAWKSSLGLDTGGDADRDGDTDGADLLVWQRQLGSGAAAEAAAAAVPEPATWALILIAAVVAPKRKRPRSIA